MIKPKYKLILSFQPDAQKDALSELLICDGQAKLLKPLAEDAALIETALTFEKLALLFHKNPPIFIRHMQPVQETLSLTGTRQDLQEINSCFFDMMHGLQTGKSFSVQTRVFDAVAYKPFDVNGLLSQNAVGAGFVLDVTAPEQAVSVCIAAGIAYLGISLCKDNLSDWAGGRHRFAKEEGQLSRAEFKLMEALDYFKIDIPKGCTVLDLGAAPGGWSHVLLDKGAHVTAVDPAALDESLLQQPHLTALRDTAQNFLARNEQVFDMIVNDMRMESLDSAGLICSFHPYLKDGGLVILTLKLHDKAMRATALKAIRALEQVYTVKGARQLFHNRCEITVILRKE